MPTKICKVCGWPLANEAGELLLCKCEESEVEMLIRSGMSMKEARTSALTYGVSNCREARQFAKERSAEHPDFLRGYLVAQANCELSFTEAEEEELMAIGFSEERAMEFVKQRGPTESRQLRLDLVRKLTPGLQDDEREVNEFVVCGLSRAEARKVVEENGPIEARSMRWDSIRNSSFRLHVSTPETRKRAAQEAKDAEERARRREAEWRRKRAEEEAAEKARKEQRRRELIRAIGRVHLPTSNESLDSLEDYEHTALRLIAARSDQVLSDGTLYGATGQIRLRSDAALIGMGSGEFEIAAKRMLKLGILRVWQKNGSSPYVYTVVAGPE